ncbi:hypothetical protein ACU5EH_20175 [Aliivibrio salmonicida]|uniref:hypothetical protein n=1 Tax=Aliivibrio salmonicida TaxID=40269 RepID=UPI00406C9CF3
MKINLIKCEACNTDISPLSETCPKCGNPNNWTHPVVSDFLKAPILVEQKYTYSCNKTGIHGVAEKTISNPLKYSIFAITFFLACLCFAVLGVFSLMGFAFIVSPYLIIALIKHKQDDIYFTYDAHNNLWESNDDQMFSKVKETLLKTNN